jgi:hypothetical protein
MSVHDEKNRQGVHTAATRPAWEPMKLSDLGHVGEVLQGGGGKLSLVANDQGDVRKPKGGG